MDVGLGGVTFTPPMETCSKVVQRDAVSLACGCIKIRFFELLYLSETRRIDSTSLSFLEFRSSVASLVIRTLLVKVRGRFCTTSISK